jgi:signal transduction histidine kinase
MTDRPAAHATPPAHASLLARLQHAFDLTADWVTQLSWWKFFLFAALMLIAASILQDELFSGSEMSVQDSSERRGDDSTHILIDATGIHFNTNKRVRDPIDDPVPPKPAPSGNVAVPAIPAPPAPPLPPKVDAGGNESVHIELPPQIGEELSNAIEAAVEEKAEQKVSEYHRQASTWFKSFVSLLLLALFGMKVLVGGKKRAEAETQTANAAAEREAMQRQLSEIRMQVMQAQVEPHFLFNTLASVEYLIETDPPRASAMQRSLIKYLRAVLPQMRETALVTHLGREVDMVQSYLNLLKMRMEERLQVDLQVPKHLRHAAFPPMMLQTLVENAVKHGLECKEEGGHLKIVADVSGTQLRVTVIDDGVGFGAVPSDGTGLGLQTIRDRLRLLHGDAGQLHIAANLPSGVIATIEVPFELANAQAQGA